jgi:hypothetical protein
MIRQVHLQFSTHSAVYGNILLFGLQEYKDGQLISK